MAPKRKASSDSEEVDSPAAKRGRYSAYSIKFKLEVVSYIKQGLHSKESAAKKFGVATKSVRQWCEQESDFGTEDNLINVLKPGSVVEEHRDLILKALQECNFNTENVIESDEEEDPLHVSISDDDDVPLAKLQF